jgi:hypothetical protein
MGGRDVYVLLWRDDREMGVGFIDDEHGLMMRDNFSSRPSCFLRATKKVHRVIQKSTYRLFDGTVDLLKRHSGLVWGPARFAGLLRGRSRLGLPN